MCNLSGELYVARANTTYGVIGVKVWIYKGGSSRVRFLLREQREQSAPTDVAAMIEMAEAATIVVLADPEKKEVTTNAASKESKV